MIPTARSPRGLMKRPLVTKSVRCRTGCVRRRKTRSIPTEGRTAGTGFWLESILPWNIVVRMARCPRERDACDRILGNVSKAVCGVFGWIAFAGIGVFCDGFPSPSLYIMTFVCFYQFLFFLGYFFFVILILAPGGCLVFQEWEGILVFVISLLHVSISWISFTFLE